MYPVLFSIGGFNIDSYYVIWGAALCAAIYWIRRRCVKLYGISFNDASDVLFWTLIGVMIGATVGGYIDNWQRYADDPSRLLRFWESGMSSGPGFIGGAIAGIIKIKRLHVSLDSFSEAASIPTAFMLFVGRWGCFCSGCCYGIPTELPIGVTFPGSAPSQPVFPTQIFESVACLIIGLILLVSERINFRRRDPAKDGMVLWPAFLIMYGLYRTFFDFLRAGDRILALRVGQYTGALAVGIGIGILIVNRRRAKNE